jgi:hypothetical protein
VRHPRRDGRRNRAAFLEVFCAGGSIEDASFAAGWTRRTTYQRAGVDFRSGLRALSSSAASRRD